MTKPKRAILNMIYTLDRITLYDLVNMRNLSTIGAKGRNAIRAKRRHFNCLLEEGYITYIDNNPTEKGTSKASDWYVELTKKGYDQLERPPLKRDKFPIKPKHHQRGVMIAVSSLYYAFDGDVSVKYEVQFPGHNHKVDAVIKHGKTLYGVELENAKNFTDTLKDIRNREKNMKLPRNFVFLYIFNNTRDGSASAQILASEIKDKQDPAKEKRNLAFLADIKHEMEMDNSFSPVNNGVTFPQHKYRMACLFEYEKFGESIWRAPGNKSTFKLI